MIKHNLLNLLDQWNKLDPKECKILDDGTYVIDDWAIVESNLMPMITSQALLEKAVRLCIQLRGWNLITSSMLDEKNECYRHKVDISINSELGGTGADNTLVKALLKVYLFVLENKDKPENLS